MRNVDLLELFKEMDNQVLNIKLATYKINSNK